jgi:hypothetical protein
MQEFVVVFDIFGKPFRTTVKAVSRFEAHEILKKKIMDNLNMRKDTPKPAQDKGFSQRDQDTIDFLSSFFFK